MRSSTRMLLSFSSKRPQVAARPGLPPSSPTNQQLALPKRTCYSFHTPTLHAASFTANVTATPHASQSILAIVSASRRYLLMHALSACRRRLDGRQKRIDLAQQSGPWLDGQYPVGKDIAAIKRLEPSLGLLIAFSRRARGEQQSFQGYGQAFDLPNANAAR